MHAIIGTAGHIDHGKTALVKALTGFDTDRLKEERERGISIDLGFAAFDVGGGLKAGVVDVPGHERFIRNMLAGAHGVDLVLLVVAADDGVMPQTEEHLDILHLLGVARGIVVVTKVDLVDRERRRSVGEEIDILLAGTSLEGSAVHEVSTVTGEGIEDLCTAIRAALAGFVRPVPQGCFRMPIDRAFVLHGHGLVVTGTATAGSIVSGAAVRVLPGRAEARVRSVQVHGETVASASFGQRVALNLAGLGREEVRRGQVVCDAALDRVTEVFDAHVELRPAARRPLRSHAPVRVHLGTAEAMARVVWLDGRPELGRKEHAHAQILLREPLAAFGGDRFILRDATARATIGGGIVLHPFARRSSRRPDPRVARLEDLRRAADSRERLKALLALESGFAVGVEDLAAAANLRPTEVRSALAAEGEAYPLPDARKTEAYATKAKWEQLRGVVENALAEFHLAAPRQPGMEMESLRSRFLPDLPPKTFRAVLERLEEERVLVRQESVVRRPTHRVALERGEEALAEVVCRLLAAGGLTPADVKTIEQELRVSPQRLAELLAQLEREGRVVRVAPELYFDPAAVERARDLIRGHVAAHGEITAAGFRDLIGASRKFSIALLNYFDRTAFTIRIGDVRKLR